MQVAATDSAATRDADVRRNERVVYQQPLVDNNNQVSGNRYSGSSFVRDRNNSLSSNRKPTWFLELRWGWCQHDCVLWDIEFAAGTLHCRQRHRSGRFLAVGSLQMFRCPVRLTGPMSVGRDTI